MNGRWFLDGGIGNRHYVQFDGEWWGLENVLPRDLSRRELQQALMHGASQWREFVIRKLLPQRVP